MRKLLSFFAALLYLFVGLLVVVFSVSNRAPVELTFYPLPYVMTAPFFVWGMLLFTGGIMIGALQSGLSLLHKKRELRHERKRIAALENEIAVLKTQSPVTHSLSPLPPSRVA